MRPHGQSWLYTFLPRMLQRMRRASLKTMRQPIWKDKESRRWLVRSWEPIFYITYIHMLHTFGVSDVWPLQLYSTCFLLPSFYHQTALYKLFLNLFMDKKTSFGNSIFFNIYLPIDIGRIKKCDIPIWV